MEGLRKAGRHEYVGFDLAFSVVRWGDALIV